MNKLEKLWKKKKGISPIVATILLILIVVAASAVVFVVVNQYLNTIEEEQLLSAETKRVTAYDFNSNSKGDLLKIGLKNTGDTIINVKSSSATISDSSNMLTSWSLDYDLSDDTIPVNGIGYLVLTTDNEVEEVLQGITYTFYFAADSDHVFSDDFTLASIEDGGDIVIKVGTTSSSPYLQAQLLSSRLSTDQLDYARSELNQLSNPRANVLVRLYQKDSTVPITYGRTDSNGEVRFVARPGEYWARIFHDFDENYTDISSIVHPQVPLAFGDDTEITKLLQVSLLPVTVQFLFKGTPVENVPVYAYKEVSIGSVTTKLLVRADPLYTNSTGEVVYLLPGNIRYTFKVAYFSSTFESEPLLLTKAEKIIMNVKEGPIKIQLLDSDDNPVKNVYVSLLGVSGKYSTTIGWGRTNDTGWILFNGVTTVEFKLRLYYGTSMTLGPYLTVAGKSYIIHLPGGVLTVRTQDNNNNSLPGIGLTLYDENGRYLGYQYSNSSGYALFVGLSPGNYTLRAYYSGITQFSDPINFQNSTMYNFTINSIIVYANVTSNGSPVRNTWVILYRESDNRYFGWAYTNDSGIASFALLASLANTSKFYFRTYSGGSYFLSNTFTIQNGLVVNIEVGGVSITVKVQDQSGNPIRYVYVWAYKNGSTEPDRNAYVYWNGQTTMQLPENQTYELIVQYTNANFSSGLFTVTAGMTVTITVTVVSFQVRVLNGDGTPSSNTYVYLYAVNKPYNTYSGYARTNSNGYASFTGVNGATYYVYAYISSIRRYVTSQPFNVSSGLVYVLQPDSMTLILEFSDGSRIADTYFYIYDASTNSWAGSYRSDANGQASISIIDGSTYYVRLYGMSYYIRSYTFTASAGGTVTVTFDLVKVYSRIIDQNNQTYVPTTTWSVYMYSYLQNGSYFSYARANSSGWVTFYLINNTTYYIQAYLNGRYKISPQFNASEGLTVDIQFEGYNLAVQFTVNGTAPSYGYAYLYTSNDRYSGSSYLNSSGFFVFSMILEGDYYLRIWYRTATGNYVWYRTDLFTMNTTDGVIRIDVPTITVYGRIYNENNNLVTSGYSYLYTLDNYYSGYSAINSSGYVTFNANYGEIYTIRAYISSIGAYVYSRLFVANQTGMIIEIHPKSLTVQVVTSDGYGVPNAYVYPLMNGTTYAGYFRTDGTGTATVWIVDNMQYFFRTWVSGNYYYTTESYNSTYTGTIQLNIGGGQVFVKVVNSNGDPISNEFVYVYTEIGYWAGYGTTNSTGYATFYLGNGTYYARTSSGYISNNFNATPGLVVTVGPSALLSSSFIAIATYSEAKRST